MEPQGDPPLDVLCERCWGPVRAGHLFVRFSHATGSHLRGHIEWAYTYLHHYDPATGCAQPEETT